MVTKTFWFNLNAFEIAELIGDQKDFEKFMNGEDPITSTLKIRDFVLAAYGIRSEDGEDFIKSDELREKFRSSMAYTALVDEFASDDGTKMNDFMTSMLPKSMGVQVNVKPVTTQVTSLPPPPTK